MSKVVLHIGTHKTATTTIQDTFHKNAGLLAEHGLVYPRLGNVTGHHGLVMDWGWLPEVYRLPSGSLGSLQQLNDMYSDQDVTLFLSSEEFSRGDPAALVDFQAVREALSGFDEIEVLCTLRIQWQFLQSVYLETSKIKNPPRPSEFARQAMKSGICDGLWVDYTRLLDHLEQSFSPDEVTFLDYETCRSAKGGIIGAFLAHLSVPIEVEDLAPVNGGASNVSPLSLASFAANVLSEPHVAPGWLVNLTGDAIRNHYGQEIKPCVFSSEEYKRLETHFETLNESLSQRRNGHQASFSLTASAESRPDVFRNHLNWDFWLRAGRRLTAELAQLK
ncbi:MAG: hypothetical protein ABJM82_14580 [Shimia thalassica]|uniref:hypothetical protein n=1 Tax=Shimia thalassica TaxID=1715693 RepID=UPI003297E5C8